MSNGLIEVMGLWQKTGKDGKKYLSGYLGNARILVFINDYKETDEQPDFRLMVTSGSRKNIPKREESVDLLAAVSDALSKISVSDEVSDDEDIRPL
ncbi:MAG: hypothetical protein ABIJ52_02570 [Pseudomonadota bacterium]